MKSPNALCTVPKLYTANGDVNKKWFVYFHYFNPSTGKNQRVRIFSGFADKNTFDKKLQHGQQLVAETTERLKNGWCPFENEPGMAVAPNHAGEVLEKGKNISAAITQLLQRLNKELLWREKTFADYQSMAKIFSEYLSACRPHIHLRAFNEKEAQLFLQWLTEKRKAGPTNRNKYRAGLGRLWQQLVRAGIAQNNPWRDIPKLRENRAGKLAFNEAQARALKQTMQKQDPWLWLVCSFQFHCFLRPVSEVRLIRVQDLDFDAQKVRIPAMNVKTHQSKILDMPEALCRELKQMQVHKLKPDFYLFGKNGRPGMEPISKNRFYKRHSKIQKAAGISSDFSLYSWKHTGNVMLYRKFKDLKMNQAINHHTDISTTDIYLRTKGAYNVEQVRTGFPKI